jgi:DNA invertase Pin-like site-specific DNA recombinase
MSKSEYIQPRHLSRLALIYVRQSSPQQTVNHQESLKLQYHLAERARACGWAPDRVRIIDADLGRSGRTTDGRAGFQELVTLVTLEQAGILFAYDVTRLARNCTDWYQLLDLCSHRQCLVGDQDGIYDPGTPNGRLILGLKGLISEMELHTIRRRMTDGLLQKARRGDLSQRLPAGLVRDALGRVVKHPDLEVQGRLTLIFDSFLRLQAMSRVVRWLNQQSLRVPRCDRFGDIVWRHATTQAVYDILQNPAYAGAFVRGRKQWTSSGGKRVAHRIALPQWPICVRDKYPAYIDWEKFEKIQTMLHDNHSDYQDKHSRGVPRPGKALLAGLLYCGECGHKLSVHYRSDVYYACHFLRTKYQIGPACQRVTAGPLDKHVAAAFLEALAPAELEAYSRALVLLQQEAAQGRRAREQQIDRLRYQAQLAERQFNRADPDNRLVAAELERRWEQALRELQAAEEEQRRQAPPLESGSPSTEMHRLLGEASQKITALWEANQLSLVQQKSLLRCLVEKVVVQRLPGALVQARIIWKGGDASSAVIPMRAASWSELPFAADVEAMIAPMAREGRSDQEIATELTAQGYRSARTSGFSAHMVLRMRLRQRVLRDHRESRPRSVPGFLTVAQLAGQLKISPSLIYDRIASGAIEIARDPKWRRYLFPDKPKTITMLRHLLDGKLRKIRCKGEHQDG